MPSQEAKIDEFEKKLEGLFVVFGPQGGFWGPDRQGYRSDFSAAGFYSKADASAIVGWRRGDRMEPAIEHYRSWRKGLSPDVALLLFGA